jgi:hypothetical protein
MKKALIAAAVTLLLLAGLPLFAQTQTSDNQPQAYYKTIPIMKIWLHPLGYLIQYFNSKQQVAQIYVPLTWFNKGINSKAEILYGNEKDYPYCTIYWVDGKFDHIRIFALTNFESGTWGVLELATDRTKQFDIQDVPREF